MEPIIEVAVLEAALAYAGVLMAIQIRELSRVAAPVRVVA